MRVVEEHEFSYKTARAGQTFNLDDGIRIQVLHPTDLLLRGTRSDLNSNSVILRLTHGDNCILFTGDAEAPTERVLLQRGVEPCNVLKVAHHGSEHSTTDAWLRAIQPDIGVISAGNGNRYGHPARETLERLHRAGTDVYRTDLHGTIRLESDGRELRISTEKLPPDVPMASSVPIDVNQIDLNLASTSDLETLPGIGPSKAAAIIAYREENGPFTSIEELDHVSGIGPSTIGKVRTHIRLGEGETTSASPPPDTLKSSASGQININVASNTQLQALHGIGTSKAAAIIAYRKEHGPFPSCDALTAVTGIGPSTVEGLRDTCSVE
jgi:competence ComEA-like helix-hairpin-helix protein